MGGCLDLFLAPLGFFVVYPPPSPEKVPRVLTSAEEDPYTPP
jgi:hypothetical protein